MSVDVRDLLGSIGQQRELTMTVPVPDYGPPGEEARFQPAEVRLVLTATPDGIFADAEIRSVADLACSRCLTRFRAPVRAEFKHLFTLGGPAAQEHESTAECGRRSADPEETGCAHDDEDVPDTSPVVDGRIDVTPLVAEAAALALPMKPLCRSDCLGLCPICGHDLSSGPCGCTRDEPDPRLAGLRDFVSPPPKSSARGAGRREQRSKETDHRGSTKA